MQRESPAMPVAKNSILQQQKLDGKSITTIRGKQEQCETGRDSKLQTSNNFASANKDVTYLSYRKRKIFAE